jgi:quercetin dioxygenase-like cupin family protein
MSIPRKLSRSQEFVFKAANAVETVVATVEGATMQGVLSVAPLVCGDDSSMTRWTRKKGLIDPLHQHDDHESIAILLSGKLRMVIDGREFIAGPGDSWVHPRGVPHYSEALEDCVQIEVKSPAIRTWRLPGDVA